jgi:hypothetical protein
MDAVYDFHDIAKRMRGEPVDKLVPSDHAVERKPGCQAIDQCRCDWPDCPCGQP